MSFALRSKSYQMLLILLTHSSNLILLYLLCLVVSLSLPYFLVYSFSSLISFPLSFLTPPSFFLPSYHPFIFSPLISSFHFLLFSLIVLALSLCSSLFPCFLFLLFFPYLLPCFLFLLFFSYFLPSFFLHTSLILIISPSHFLLFPSFVPLTLPS